MNTEKAVLSIAKSFVLSQPLDPCVFTGCDWDRLREHLSYHELGPVAQAVTGGMDGVLPTDLVEYLDRVTAECRARGQRLWKEFLALAEGAGDRGITVLPLKGIALVVDVYRSCLRPMSDIDLLVRAEDLPRMEEFLSRAGYRKVLYGRREEYWKERQFSLAFSKGDILCDVHWRLDYDRGYPQLPLVHERAWKGRLGGTDVMLLSPEDTFFSLVLHQRRYGKALCLKGVTDIALLLRRYSDRFDWEYVKAESVRGRMRCSVFLALAQVSILLGLPLPEAMDRFLEKEIPRFKKVLLRRIISKGTLPERGYDLKSLFLRLHMLLYDSVTEPVQYVVSMPVEQLSTFCGVSLHEGRSRPVRILLGFLRCLGKRLVSLLGRATGKSIRVSLTVDGGSPSITRSVGVPWPYTPLNALLSIARVESVPWYGGRMVVGINDLRNSRVRNWKYTVNGSEISELADRWLLSQGDRVTWTYTRES